MQVWLETSLTQVNVTSKQGTALPYLNNNWVRLTRFLEDGIIPLDNNAAENAIRPFVVGRQELVALEQRQRSQCKRRDLQYD